MQRVRYALDSNARRDANGTALLGGSPFRIVRLAPRGAQLVTDWLGGSSPEQSREAAQLLERLVAAGLLHPIVEPGDATGVVEVTRLAFVIPYYDDRAGLDELLVVLHEQFAGVEIVIVDDASPEPTGIDVAPAATRTVPPSPASA